jgi:diadenosine tetraphosphatase ApaH/serine/threonine PP2A family protein phosphatase
MKVAALYDIHGNLPALEAVLAEPDVAAADVVVIGGDALEGPMPVETLALLDGLGDRVRPLRGNTEREVLERRGADPEEGGVWDRRATWVAAQLGSDQLARIAAWPATVAVDVDGLGPTRFCHATPRDDYEIFTAITPAEVVEPMLAAAEPTVVCGHTHVQFDRRIGERRVVNAGSVGLPYEDVAGARWCLLGPDVELRRTAYDMEAAAERIGATGLPEAAELARQTLDPTTAEEATRHFDEMRIGRE